MVGMPFPPELQQGVGQAVGEGRAALPAVLPELLGSQPDLGAHGAEGFVRVELAEDVLGVEDAAEIAVGDQDEAVVGGGRAGDAAEEVHPRSAAGAVGGVGDGFPEVRGIDPGGQVQGEQTFVDVDLERVLGGVVGASHVRHGSILAGAADKGVTPV